VANGAQVMIAELPFVVMVGGAGFLGLYLANLFYDFHIPQYISRKIGHLGGCVAFLLSPLLFSSFWWPLIVTTGFTGLLLYARMSRPSLFRGVGGSGRVDALAEIHFPATGVILIAVVWGILGYPWLAIIPLTFMGAGDAVTGLVRNAVYKREVKGNWGTVGMLVTCLTLAYFVQPYYVGVAGAVTATLAERFTKTTRFVDDNLTIPLVSGAVMLLLQILIVEA